MVSRGLTYAFAFLAAIVALIYQLLLRKQLILYGSFRTVSPYTGDNCVKVDTLKACEKIILHQPSGKLYLACSTPERRQAWTPSLQLLNTSGAGRDYLAVYDHDSVRKEVIQLRGFTDSRKYSSHGFDLVPDEKNPKTLWLYAINHRKPLTGDAKKVGADSVVEIFKGSTTSYIFQYERTVKSQHLITPNDIIGSSDGKSFHWTNDYGTRTGLSRHAESWLGLKRGSIGYCHVDKGCKIALAGFANPNGIVRAPNGTVYVGSTQGFIHALEPQKGGSLTLGDFIRTDRPIDDLSLDANGALYAGAFPQAIKAVDHFVKGTQAASAALRITINTGESSFFGEKYKVDTVFEDDGSLMPPATSIVYDVKRKRLFLHGETYERAWFLMLKNRQA